jgi:hypothetical protein
MFTLSQVTWMTLWGLSLLFVGGLVLWVYGTQKARSDSDAFAPQTGKLPQYRKQLMQWLFLYGGITVFVGAGLLLTTALALI